MSYGLTACLAWNSHNSDLIAELHPANAIQVWKEGGHPQKLFPKLNIFMVCIPD